MALTKEQMNFFWDNGYLVVENAVSEESLRACQADFAAWIDESREHQTAYWTTINDKPRFDLSRATLRNNRHCVELMHPSKYQKPISTLPRTVR